MKLNGQVAIVTGGGTGVGQATSLKLAAEGCTVIVNYSRSKKEAAETVNTIVEAGGRALSHQADVGDDPQVKAMVEQATSQFGRLDILVNNAGGPGKGYGSLEKVDRARFDHTLEINLSAAYSLTHQALPLLRAGSAATIINISSALAWMVDRHFAAYGAAKAGMEQMTRILAYELAPDMRVNAIAPGAIETPSTAFITQNPEMLASTTRWIPQGRMGQPEDIALAALYLASPASSFVSGKVLEVDGGMAALPGSAIGT